MWSYQREETCIRLCYSPAQFTVGVYGFLDEVVKARLQWFFGAYEREIHFPSTQNGTSNKLAEKVPGIDAFYLIQRDTHLISAHSRVLLNLLY